MNSFYWAPYPGRDSGYGSSKLSLSVLGTTFIDFRLYSLFLSGFICFEWCTDISQNCNKSLGLECFCPTEFEVNEYNIREMLTS